MKLRICSLVGILFACFLLSVFIKLTACDEETTETSEQPEGGEISPATETDEASKEEHQETDEKSTEIEPTSEEPPKVDVAPATPDAPATSNVDPDNMNRRFDKIISTYENNVSESKTVAEVVEDLVKARSGHPRISMSELRKWIAKILEATDTQLATIEDLLIYYANDAKRVEKLNNAKQYYEELRDAVVDSGFADSTSCPVHFLFIAIFSVFVLI